MLQKFGTLLGTRKNYLYHQHGGDDNNDNDNDNRTKFVSASKLPKIPITTNLDVQLRLDDEDDEDKNRIGGNRIDEDENPAPVPAAGTDHYRQTKTKPPRLVCARHGVAGFGAISDHGDGTRSHGWEAKDYKISHNQGRGGKLYEFRNYLVRNLFGGSSSSGSGSGNVVGRTTTHSPPPIIDGPIKRDQRPAFFEPDSVVRGMEKFGVANDDAAAKRDNAKDNNASIPFPPSSIHDWAEDEPLVVLFSALSSRTRGSDMVGPANDLRDAIAKRGGPGRAVMGESYDPSNNNPADANLRVVVETHRFSDYTLEEQIAMASRTAVYVTYSGGGAVTAAFLPQGCVPPGLLP
eukprot:jgi/Psemu1/292380/fgenesh1_pg.1023_\